MVNNSTDINKKNNHLSPLLSEHIIDHHDVGNPHPSFGRAEKCGGVKPVNGIPAPPLNLLMGSQPPL